MVRLPLVSPVTLILLSLGLIFTMSQPDVLEAAKKTYKRPIRNPKFDPTAEQVDLFDAVDKAQISVKLVPANAMGGNVLIENKTENPLTIKVPEAVVGIAVNAQFGGGGGGFGGGGLGGGGLGGGGGGQQALGGGLGGGGGQGGGGLGGGGGFFSVPAEKVVSIPFNSVCLEHGKPEPHPGSKYTIVPVSRVSNDPVLYKLLTAVGTGKVDHQAAQAAAWHLANNMSFEELAAKTDQSPDALATQSYFTNDQLNEASVLLARSVEQVAEDRSSGKSEPKAETPVRTAKPGRIAR